MLDAERKVMKLIHAEQLHPLCKKEDQYEDVPPDLLKYAVAVTPRNSIELDARATQQEIWPSAFYVASNSLGIIVFRTSEVRACLPTEPVAQQKPIDLPAPPSPSIPTPHPTEPSLSEPPKSVGPTIQARRATDADYDAGIQWSAAQSSDGLTSGRQLRGDAPKWCERNGVTYSDRAAWELWLKEHRPELMRSTGKHGPPAG
jgi:hypothetical protein